MGVNLNVTFMCPETEWYVNEKSRGNVVGWCIRYFCSEISIYSGRCSVS
jgi:hypothetical protein